MKVGHAVGISVTSRGKGRVRLRWRQDERQADGTVKRVQREVFAYDKMEAKQLEIDIERQVRERGWWAPPSEETKVKPLDAELEYIAKRWLTWKKARGAKVNTLTALAGAVTRWLRAVRELRGLAPDASLKAAALTTKQATDVIVHWQTAGYAEGTIYQSAAAILDLWTWAADEPDFRELVPPPPRHRKSVMPATAKYVAPQLVPTWAETDAALRQIRLPMPRRLATIMRYTGLRLEQAVFIHREDFDLNEGTLLVRKGKSQREKALNRTVPVAPGLIRDLRDWLLAQPPGPLFSQLKDASIPMKSYRNMTRYVTEAWEAATEGGEVRGEVWAPSNRVKARPDHAFRAAFQHHLMDEGVSDNVIDYLVGHAPASTRGKHYAAAPESAQRRAVALIPPVEWLESNTTVLRFDKRARA
jgi:integrase